MHRLILMRHAKAERDAPTGRDRDRPLSAGGRSDAALMGRALRERGLRPDLALISSAARTRETWEVMEDAFGDVEVRLEPDLYNADAHELRRFVEAEEDTAGCLILVAHNPGVHELAVQLLTESAASPSVLDKLSSGFPTGAAAVFTVDPAGRCAYDGFFTPKAFGGGED